MRALDELEGWMSSSFRKRCIEQLYADHPSAIPVTLF